jgi:hypothetical protein
MPAEFDVTEKVAFITGETRSGLHIANLGKVVPGIPCRGNRRVYDSEKRVCLTAIT